MEISIKITTDVFIKAATGVSAPQSAFIRQKKTIKKIVSAVSNSWQKRKK